MRDLRDIIRDAQAEVGVERDGLAGRVTWENILAALQARHADPQAAKEMPAKTAELITFDARSEAVLATLDPKAQPMFRKFLALAQATAASLGCEYKLISGNRTYAEQDALYAQGRTKAGNIVTKAKGGQSNHNFAIAVDAGVFRGKLYLDGGNAGEALTASRVHKACSMHAQACGLEWGGSWKSIKDEPHYEVSTGLTLAQKRSLYEKKGSVL